MNRISRLIVCLIFLVLASGAAGQSMLGLSAGNYTGVNSIMLNPSALAHSKTWLDIRLAGMDIFFSNNYLYLPAEEYKFANFFKSGYEWPSHTEEYTFESRIPYRYTNKHLKRAFNQQWILGPGASLLYKNHSFAFTTGMREIVSVRNLPYELANFSWLGLSYSPQQNINYRDRIPVRAAGMAWAEIALTYANTFYQRGFDTWTAGISVKRAMSFGGFYLYTSDLDYVIPDDTTIVINNLDADMGMAIPLDYQTNEINTDPLFKGNGFGVDVGITYKRLLRYHSDEDYGPLCAWPYAEYKYRIGLALLDFGGVRFKSNAVKMKIDNRSSTWENVDDLPFTNLDQFLDTLSYRFYGDYSSARVADGYFQWLPLAFSAQFDYRLTKQWYLNASLIHGIPLAKSLIVRPPELAITPRYESPLFDISLPVSLYEWTKPRIGLAMRIYGLTVGTEQLGSYLGFSDFTGLDFYFSLNIFFNRGGCNSSSPMHCGEDKILKIKK